MKQSIWRDDPPIQFTDDDPALLQDLSRGEWIVIALACAICGVVGFVLGFGVTSWIN